MNENQNIELKKNGNGGLIVVIVLLVICVLGLGGYIAYDKFFAKDDKPKNNTVDNAVVNDNTQQGGEYIVPVDDLLYDVTGNEKSYTCKDDDYCNDIFEDVISSDKKYLVSSKFYNSYDGFNDLWGFIITIKDNKTKKTIKSFRGQTEVESIIDFTVNGKTIYAMSCNPRRGSSGAYDMLLTEDLRAFVDYSSKSLFNLFNAEFSSDNIIVWGIEAEEKFFKVYNGYGTKLFESKKYDQIGGIIPGYAVVRTNKSVGLVDVNGNYIELGKTDSNEEIAMGSEENESIVEYDYETDTVKIITRIMFEKRGTDGELYIDHYTIKEYTYNFKTKKVNVKIQENVEDYDF